MMNDGPISSHLARRVGCLILITMRAGGVEVDVVSGAPHLPPLAPEQTGGVKQLWFVKYSVAISILSHVSAPHSHKRRDSGERVWARCKRGHTPKCHQRP